MEAQLEASLFPLQGYSDLLGKSSATGWEKKSNGKEEENKTKKKNQN